MGPVEVSQAAKQIWRNSGPSFHAAYGVLRRFSMSSPPPSPTLRRRMEREPAGFLRARPQRRSRRGPGRPERFRGQGRAGSPVRGRNGFTRYSNCWLDGLTTVRRPVPDTDRGTDRRWPEAEKELLALLAICAAACLDTIQKANRSTDDSIAVIEVRQVRASLNAPELAQRAVTTGGAMARQGLVRYRAAETFGQCAIERRIVADVISWRVRRSFA